jgi:hypothetical protein
MMGVLVIDGVGARVDSLGEVAFDLYHRRMTLTSALPKTVPLSREAKRAQSVDPLLRMLLRLPVLICSSIRYE